MTGGFYRCEDGFNVAGDKHALAHASSFSREIATPCGGSLRRLTTESTSRDRSIGSSPLIFHHYHRTHHICVLFLDHYGSHRHLPLQEEPTLSVSRVGVGVIVRADCNDSDLETYILTIQLIPGLVCDIGGLTRVMICQPINSLNGKKVKSLATSEVPDYYNNLRS